MVQLAILTGEKAGQSRTFCHFPLQIGRAAGAHLPLEDKGVWNQHACVRFLPGEGFLLEAYPGALMRVNGERTEKSRLRNGDTIEFGSAKVRFWLSSLRQRNLRPREALTWLALAGLLVLQMALIYRLLA
ncbi:MAG: FHA domain-containing protein [Verrucomicrobia bacterium]|nr:FHA domain-containing protein [Verrucomicrobiota bacterium]